MQNATFFLAQPQYDWLATKLPEPVVKTKPVTPNNELLNGVLFVLKTGCRWQDIPASVCNHGYSSCWRRFNYWRQKGGLKLVWQEVLVLLDKQGTLDMSLGHLDGSLVQSPKFQGTGFSKKHKRTGTNISLVTDKQGLPLADTLAKGNRHDQYSAEATVRKIRVGAKRRLAELNADKGYDSAAFRRQLRKLGISLNASTSTDASLAVNRATTKLPASSGLSWNVPTPDLNTSVNYATDGSGRNACFRPALTRPV